MTVALPELKLRAWDGDALRRQAVELLEAVASTEVFFYSLEASDGGVHYTHTVFSDDIAWHLNQFDGARVFDDSLVYRADSRDWSVRDPDPDLVNRFSRVIDDYGSRHIVYEFETWRHAFAPVDCTDQARALFYDGDRFIGSAAVLRRGGEMCDDQSVANIQRHAHTAYRLILLADRASQGSQQAPMHLMIDESGQILFADELAATWLTRRRSELLSRVLSSQSCHLIDGFAPTYGWLDDGCRKLRHVVLSPTRALRTTRWSKLSGTQRTIVELALSGLSNREIARLQGLSPSTVKYHLAQASRQLDVTGRQGLLDTLRDRDCPVG